jgi:hypothetical protein
VKRQQKTFRFSRVMKVVVSVLNFIRSREPNQGQLQFFFRSKVNAEHGYIL